MPDQNADNSAGTLMLTFNSILSTSDFVHVFIVLILSPNRPQMYLF